MKHALIIGGSRGIGLGLAGEHLARGWRVTVTVRTLTAEVESLRSGFGEALEIIAPVDIRDQEEVAGLASYLRDQTFNLLVLNAGVMHGRHASLADVPADAIHDLFMTNAVSPIRAADQLITNVHPGGMIVFISSKLASVGGRDHARAELYSASKAALNSLIRSFCARRPELDATVLSMHPGVVKTAITDFKAPLDVETSVAGIADTIEQRWGSGGHAFVDYQNQTMPW